MTKQEILEGNKFIAEFMGVKNLKDYKGDLWDFNNTNEQIYCIRTKELGYHRSWDSLMPVIRKAISKDLYWGLWTNQVHDGLLECNLNMCYEAIVGFVKQELCQKKK